MSSLSVLFTLLLFVQTIAQAVQTDMDSRFKLSAAGALQWPGYDGVEVDVDEEEQVENEGMERRSLYWRSMHYYISYGALSANRIPCPARSGRSYYTPNCHASTRPALPYSRGCSVITRCRR